MKTIQRKTVSVELKNLASFLTRVKAEDFVIINNRFVGYKETLTIAVKFLDTKKKS